jgi:hypothetical protein
MEQEGKIYHGLDDGVALDGACFYGELAVLHMGVEKALRLLGSDERPSTEYTIFY